MSWGIAVLLLSLFHSHGKKASFAKLQFLAHSIRTPEGREDVYSMLRGELRTSEVSFRVEPWLNRAVAFAHGLRLVAVAKGKTVELTDHGKAIAIEIIDDTAVLGEERTFLSAVTKRLTEAQLGRIWRMEALL